MEKAFEFKGDKDYFDELFSDLGGVHNHIHHFDFRDPKDKRDEFNKIRRRIFINGVRETSKAMRTENNG